MHLLMQGLFVYLVLIPLPDLGKYFPKQNWEEKLTYSRNGGNNLENPITKKLSNVLQYPKGKQIMFHAHFIVLTPS